MYHMKWSATAASRFSTFLEKGRIESVRRTRRRRSVAELGDRRGEYVVINDSSPLRLLLIRNPRYFRVNKENRHAELLIFWRLE